MRNISSGRKAVNHRKENVGHTVQVESTHFLEVK